MCSEEHPDPVYPVSIRVDGPGRQTTCDVIKRTQRSSTQVRSKPEMNNNKNIPKVFVILIHNKDEG